jgi:hypothetical protein
MAALITTVALHQAQATFVQNFDFKGEVKLFNDADHKNVTDFDATVGGHTGPAVHIHTDGPVDSGAGFANITPVHGTTLFDIIITPADMTLFSDFSFRGQLTSAGVVELTVTDQFGTAFNFFTVSEGKDDDIPRFGVISLDGETIKSVELSVVSPESFKEIKQLEFSFGVGAVPDGGSTLMMLGGAIGILGLVSRFKKSALLSLLAAGALGFGSQAQAAQITGEIHMAGDVIFNTVDLSSSTAVNHWISTANNLERATTFGATGDFAVIPASTEADMTHPWTFSPSTTTAPLWSVSAFGFSFDLLSVTSVTKIGDNFLNVLASGIVHATGFDDTPGLFSFTVDNPDGLTHLTYSFADATITVPSVPDGGATVMLLGLALSGVGLVRRFMLA